MTIHPTTNWTRAMQRARDNKLKATRCTDGTFRIPSKSNPGSFQVVTLDPAGRINECTCKGWQHYGRQNPCQHAGAVLVALAFLSGHSIAVQHKSIPGADEMPVGSSSTSARQLFRTEAVA